MGMIIIGGAVILVVALFAIFALLKGIGTSKSNIAKIFMGCLLIPLLCIAGYIVFVGVEVYSGAP